MYYKVTLHLQSNPTCSPDISIYIETQYVVQIYPFTK